MCYSAIKVIAQYIKKKSADYGAFYLCDVLMKILLCELYKP